MSGTPGSESVVARSGALAGRLAPRTIAAAAAAAMALLASVLVFVGCRGTPAGGEDPLSPATRASLTARIVSIMETDPDARRVLTTDVSQRLACAARPVGADPRGAGADAVRTVFAWVVCRTVDRQPPSGVSVPVAIEFGPPPRASWPADGAGYPPSLRRIFPRRLHHVLLERHGLPIKDLVAESDARATTLASQR